MRDAMRRPYLQYGAIVLAVGALFLASKSLAIGHNQTQKPGGEDPSATWLRFAPKGAPFSVRLPNLPDERVIDLGSCTPAHVYRVRGSGCYLEVYWAANLSDYMSQTESVRRVLAQLVSERRLVLGWDDSTIKRDRAVAVDGNAGLEAIAQYSGVALRAWAFPLNTKDIGGPSPSHDFIALLATTDGSESGLRESDRFFGSLSLYLPFPEADGDSLAERSDPIADLLKLMASPVVTTKPVPLNRPRPAYTAESESANVQGTVRARALVGADGMVKEIELIDHLPCGLDQEAILAIKKMRFKPATEAGKPTEAWTEVEVEFQSRGRRR